MCTSCVDRLFTSGPAPCPVAGCHKTLRKKGFHTAFFGDLTIEREVDVRKRVGAVFNRHEHEFETLRHWNDYLEKVEKLVFDIVYGTEADKKKAEQALKEYAESNRTEILENERVDREEDEEIKRKGRQDAQTLRIKRLAVAREEEEKRREVERTKQNALDALARGDGDAAKITRRAQMEIARKTERKSGEEPKETGRREQGLTILGLKRKVVPVLEKPYDPFDGIDLTPTRYILQDDYMNEWLDGAKNDLRHMVGGYSLQEYYSRTMFEAFSGLGVIIEDELANRENLGLKVVVAGAETGRKVADDPF
jgi:CDK-activating kinase assembly factor MAT1